MEYKQVTSPDCRTCAHTKDFHYPNLGIPNIPPLPCKYGMANRNMTISCLCKEFLPVDNLEYLEYKHGQKEDRIS